MANDKIKWLGKPEERILSIRKFRKYIDTISFDQAVKLTQNNWINSPKINNLQFDITEVDSWPTPWELFSNSVFCQNSQILGAFYTLILSKHIETHSIELIIVDDVINGVNGAIVLDKSPLKIIKGEPLKTISITDLTEKLGE
jgi:hypothetical protein